MTVRLWVEKESVNRNITDDGDVIINAEDFYFFKRNEIANEEGFHLEFSSSSGGFELFVSYSEFRRIVRQMDNKVLDYAVEKDND